MSSLQFYLSTVSSLLPIGMVHGATLHFPSTNSPDHASDLNSSNTTYLHPELQLHIPPLRRPLHTPRWGPRRLLRTRLNSCWVIRGNLFRSTGCFNQMVIDALNLC